MKNEKDHKEHLKARDKLKGIYRKSDFYNIIEDAMLSEMEKKIMVMHYVEKKDFACIADELGYSEIGIIKKHKRILSIISKII